MNDFDLGQFLVNELKDLHKKMDDNQKETNDNMNSLRTCMYQKIDGVKKDVNTKIDEVKTEVNNKFATHAQLHIANAKSFISTKLFIAAMVLIVGGIGTVSLLANNNRVAITEIQTQHEVEQKATEKVEIEVNEKRLPDKDKDK